MFRRPAGACRIFSENPVVVTTGYNSDKPPAFKQRSLPLATAMRVLGSDGALPSIV
jgi:hypothetical protein